MEEGIKLKGTIYTRKSGWFVVKRKHTQIVTSNTISIIICCKASQTKLSNDKDHYVLFELYQNVDGELISQANSFSYTDDHQYVTSTYELINNKSKLPYTDKKLDELLIHNILTYEGGNKSFRE